MATRLPVGFLNAPEVVWVRRYRRTRILRRRKLVVKVKLLEDLLFRDEEGRRLRVPAGFETDLASVPRWIPGLLRLLIPDKLESAWAGILHDWLYKTGRVCRRVADAIFYRALRLSGATRVGAGLMWAAVRSPGGWLAWRRHRKRKQRARGLGLRRVP